MAAVARQLRAGRRPGLLRLLGLLGLGLAAMLASTGGSVAKASATSAAAPPPCAAAGLVVWLDTREGRAAGSVYYRLELTNLGARTCSLRGYPGVSAVDLSGRQLGSAAGRNPAHAARRLLLAPRATATAVLHVAQAANFSAARCRPTMAAGLRVYPPGQTVARVVPFPFPACSRRGPVYLTVQPVQKA